MANREKGTADADKYSELIQVLVKPATKKNCRLARLLKEKLFLVLCAMFAKKKQTKNMRFNNGLCENKNKT